MCVEGVGPDVCRCHKFDRLSHGVDDATASLVGRGGRYYDISVFRRSRVSLLAGLMEAAAAGESSGIIPDGSG